MKTMHFIFQAYILKFYLFIYLVFLGLHLHHMEVPRLGVESELQLPAYTTTTAMRDLSHICNLHCSSRQCRILNPLNEARDQTCNLTVPRQIRFHCPTTGTPDLAYFLKEASEPCLRPTPQLMATPDPSCIFDVHCSSWQYQTLNPLSEARNRTCVLMDTSQICLL